MCLPFDDIIRIHAEAVKSGLHNKRFQMLFGVSGEYVAGLDLADNPSGQLLSDLQAMNQVGRIVGDVIPLERWLRNAAYATSPIPGRQKFFRQFADEVAKNVEATTDAPPTGETPKTLEERALFFVSELLPFGFLAGATRTGRSVAKLTVPRFESGQTVNHPASSETVQYYGTGWLIGPKHIITNYHVINSRNDGEAPASPSDFDLQGRGTTIQLDYDQEGSAGEKFTAVQLSAADAPLDFAILELDRESGRQPLPLWGRPVQLTAGSRLPVNIIQHPAGEPKQVAIRNNLAAAVHAGDLAYYTETNGGSSGSPVCNDQWQVLALHKNSTMALGEFSYQGKKTAWINTGTMMHRIIEHLQKQPADLLQRIGATMV